MAIASNEADKEEAWSPLLIGFVASVMGYVGMF